MIGSVEPGFLYQLPLHALTDGQHPLLQQERPETRGWRLMGDVTTSLHRIALALRDAGLAGAWRDEQLAVPDQFGHRQGTVERAAVRPLGIATLAVHLVGQAPDGRLWVQQRAWNKANDPGLWDTLMGGMVSAGDTPDTALARETWEEAGLRIGDVQSLAHGGRVVIRRPSSDGGGAGYVREDIDWYLCTVPKGMAPVNQDGEVVQFALMAREELAQALQRGEFTLEAALILAAVLGLAP